MPDALGTVRDGCLLLEDGFWLRISTITAVQDLEAPTSPAGTHDAALARGDRSLIHFVGSARWTKVGASEVRAIVTQYERWHDA